jgi:thiosulfate/3-mercaptopyruvate sulfurtransferase
LGSHHIRPPADPHDAGVAQTDGGHNRGIGPLISAGELASSDPRPTILDVRWELGKPSQRPEYERGHIPGAVFVELDTELAAAAGPAGRHPLPSAEAFQASMRAAGVSGGCPVVVYDGSASLAAARAWWLLRYFGHDDVSVLDGGLAAWVAGGGRLESGAIPLGDGDFVARPGAMPVVDANGAVELARRGLLLDARAPERFSGEVEPIDPVAGHIPGARNRPTTENLEPDGRFKAPGELREQFGALGVDSVAAMGTYCGSGVTATHEILALELAGFPGAALYAGSWSEWITDPARPVAWGSG